MRWGSENTAVPIVNGLKAIYAFDMRTNGMKPCFRYLTLLAVVFSAISCGDDEKPQSVSILERVPELQETARQANAGSLGCGGGTITLMTSRGEVKAKSGLDPVHVFGPKIDVSDIHILLQSRVDSNRTGRPGPMSGEVGDLCYVCLYTLSLAKDPESIPVLVPLLRDTNGTVCRWTAVALKAIADSDPALKKAIDEATKKENAGPSSRPTS